MTRSTRGRTGLAALVVVSACVGSAGERDAPVPPWSIESARILFTARYDGVSDLYILDRTTGETTRLTTFGTPEGGAGTARISPDGSRLAFQVRRGTDYEIHVMDLPHGESRNVTNHPEYDVLPVWSPDGRTLAFMSTRGFELGGIGPFPGHIYILNLDNDSLTRVTREPLTSSLGPSDWSADGASILMARATGTGPDIYRLDVLSGTEVQLSTATEGEYSAHYSHSGDRIAFHSESETGSQIAVLDLATNEQSVITTGPGYRYNPVWSPDDLWLLYTASDDGDQYDLRALRISDGVEVEILATPEDEREGIWVPGT